MKAIDLTGKTFERLTVLSRGTYVVYKSGARAIGWLCMCSCGTQKLVNQGSLTSGATKSCGCLKREIAKNNNLKTHGMAKTPEYRSWAAMLSRCSDKNNSNYHNYGGRGLTVSRRWKSFANFLHDMGPRPSLKYSLDRINNDKGYSAKNCKWSTKKEQGNNKRSNRIVTFNGITGTVSQICDMLSLKKQNAISARLILGWSIEKAFTTPVGLRLGLLNKKVQESLGM